jgi:hypothetical protein
MKKELITLKEFVSKHNCTTAEFYRMLLRNDEGGKGISNSSLERLSKQVNPMVELRTLILIWKTTKKEFGEALTCSEWIDTPPFWEK